MTPEEFRQQFMKLRGLNIDSTPVVSPPIVPTPITPVPVRSMDAPPIRTNPDGTLAGNLTSNRIDNPDVWNKGAPSVNTVVPPTPPPPVRPPVPLPNDAPAVPYTNPVVQQSPTGITLNSTPAAPGWAGTIGQTASPEAAQAYDAGKNNEKIMGGLDEIAKGLHPKAQQVQVPNLLAGAPEPNQANQMAAQLMAAMVNRNRGLTLTGR